MWTLIATIIILIISYFIQKYKPFIAGFLAVIPIKIVGTMLMANENGGRDLMIKSIGGMIIGQFSIGILLLVFYLWLKRG